MYPVCPIGGSAMEEDYAVQKKKLSPAALTAIIAGGVLLIAVIAIVVYFAFFRTGSLIDDWHDEEEVVQYTFYGDNKMIVDTPYGEYIGRYVFDKETGKGIISMEGGSIEFSFEKNKVVLNNGSVLNRGRISVIHITIPPEVTIDATETTTTQPETTPAEITTESTIAETTIAPTTVEATTEATTVPETAVETTTVETTPAVTTTETPIVTVSFPTYEIVWPTYSVLPVFPTWTYVVGTPIVGNWTDVDTGEWLLVFLDDETCTITWGTWSYGSTYYEYNFFTGNGSMTVNTSDFEFQVTGDELLLTNIDASSSQLFTRVT